MLSSSKFLLTQGWNLRLRCLLRWQAGSSPAEPSSPFWPLSLQPGELRAHSRHLPRPGLCSHRQPGLDTPVPVGRRTGERRDEPAVSGREAPQLRSAEAGVSPPQGPQSIRSSITASAEQWGNGQDAGTSEVPRPARS